MDNLSEKINSLLSDPGAMAQIQAMASSLGLGGEASPSPPPVSKPAPELPSLSALGPLLAMGQQEDDSTRLLMALRPMLSAEKQDKLDKALKMLKLMRMIPFIKDSGILSSLI